MRPPKAVISGSRFWGLPPLPPLAAAPSPPTPWPGKGGGDAEDALGRNSGARGGGVRDQRPVLGPVAPPAAPLPGPLSIAERQGDVARTAAARRDGGRPGAEAKRGGRAEADPAESAALGARLWRQGTPAALRHTAERPRARPGLPPPRDGCIAGAERGASRGRGAGVAAAGLPGHGSAGVAEGRPGELPSDLAAAGPGPAPVGCPSAGSPLAPACV